MQTRTAPGVEGGTRKYDSHVPFADQAWLAPWSRPLGGRCTTSSSKFLSPLETTNLKTCVPVSTGRSSTTRCRRGTDAAVRSKVETCNGIDDNCDNVVDNIVDLDGDGQVCGADCDDRRSDVYVDAPEGRLGIQSKRYADGALKLKHVEHEVSEADKADAPIVRLIVATTATSDAVLLREVQDLSDARVA